MKNKINIIDYILSYENQTLDEYIEDCKYCFSQFSLEDQEEIQNSNTDDLIDYIKSHNWSTAFTDYCKAIKHELMLRLDFKERI